jgi:hypothetical protein
MEQVFGAVTPFSIMMVVTLLTQWIKANYTLTARQVQYVALAFSLVLIVAFQLLTVEGIDAFAVFSALIFALLGWFAAIGMYEVATKQLGK